MTDTMNNTQKRIFYAWSYGAGFIMLAKRYGWRSVRETQRIIFKRKVEPNDQHQ